MILAASRASPLHSLQALLLNLLSSGRRSLSSPSASPAGNSATRSGGSHRQSPPVGIDLIRYESGCQVPTVWSGASLGSRTTLGHQLQGIRARTTCPGLYRLSSTAIEAASASSAPAAFLRSLRRSRSRGAALLGVATAAGEADLGVAAGVASPPTSGVCTVGAAGISTVSLSQVGILRSRWGRPQSDARGATIGASGAGGGGATRGTVAGRGTGGRTGVWVGVAKDDEMEWTNCTRVVAFFAATRAVGGLGLAPVRLGADCERGSVLAADTSRSTRWGVGAGAGCEYLSEAWLSLSRFGGGGFDAVELVTCLSVGGGR